MARIAVAAGALSLLLLTLLHVLRPDLDPRSHVISEYALGEFGGLLLIWFLTLALGSAALSVALARYAQTVFAKIGLGFLLLGTIGLIMGGSFPMDPIGTPPEQASFGAQMHNLAAMVGITSLVLAALLLGMGLRKRERWVGVRGWLTTLTHLTWIGDVAMITAVVQVFSQPQPAEAVNLIGLGNRVLMVAFSGWLIAAAWPLTEWSRATPPPQS